MVLEILKRVRQNHALEHATIAVLLRGGLRPPLGGYSTPGGFFIYGKVSTESVRHAVEEALGRLRDGEKGLAVSPYCGTNLVVGVVVARLLSRLLLGKAGRWPSSALSVLAVVAGAMLLRRPLGEAVQRRYTILPQVETMDIARVRCLRSGTFTIHRVDMAFDSSEVAYGRLRA